MYKTKFQLQDWLLSKTRGIWNKAFCHSMTTKKREFAVLYVAKPFCSLFQFDLCFDV
jgi:hypothetical protein